MPAKPHLPAVRTTVVPVPKAVLSDELKKGYSFFNDRWEGEDNYATAWAVACHWQSQGWVSNVHEDKAEKWAAGKKTTEPYFKVWIRHPTYPSLYSWWAPTDSEWVDPPKVDELTWFEFVKPKVTKK